MKNSDRRFLVLLILMLALMLWGTIGKAQSALLPTIEELRLELDKQEIQHSDIVLRQVIQETGWLKCTHCSLDHNNIFGFWYKGAYLKFSNWEQSIAYYKRWQDRHYKGGDYYQFLTDRGYAEDPKYINKLKSIKI